MPGFSFHRALLARQLVPGVPGSRLEWERGNSLILGSVPIVLLAPTAFENI